MTRWRYELSTICESLDRSHCGNSLNYGQARTPVLPGAVRQFRKPRIYERRAILYGIDRHPVEAAPEETAPTKETSDLAMGVQDLSQVFLLSLP